MAIQLEARDFPGVVQLIANTEGWGIQQTNYQFNPRYVGGHPDKYLETPEQLREPLGRAWRITKDQRPTDTDDLKASVGRISVRGGILRTDAHMTDYFTMWGVRQAAPELIQRHEEEVVINTDNSTDSTAVYETSFPWAIATHNVLLDKNGDILLTVRAGSQGWYGGRASLTVEEQMDPDKDFSPFNTAYRGYFEELGILVPTASVRLLGVGMEKKVSYITHCFVANTELTAIGAIDTWMQAPDHTDNTNLFSVPAGQINEWLKGEISPEVWGKYHLAGQINPEAV